MSDAFSIRTDPEVRTAFETLGVTRGNRSAIVKRAILALASDHERALLRQESARLARDADDAAELRQVQQDLEAVRAW